MTVDWLLVSCIVSALVACGLGLALFINWRLDRAAGWFAGKPDIRQSLPDPMAEAHGDVCPWPDDFKASHSTSVDEGAQRNHG